MHISKTITYKIKTALLFCLILVGFSSLGACHDCTLDKNKSHAHCLPPDPGNAGKATIEGIDSDNDGVRDDVQIALNKRYPNNEAKRNALSQQAIATQKALLAGAASNSAAIFSAERAITDAVACLGATFTGDSELVNESGFIIRSMINTKARAEAYDKFNTTLSGNFFGTSQSADPCATNKRTAQ